MMAQETEGRPRLLQAALDALRVPDLRSKIIFTFALLAIYRLIAQVPVPGVDQVQLDSLFERIQLLGFLDLFSGGALRNLSILALGVFPYITASIVMQLLTPVVPRLQALSKEGEHGRAQINKIVHWGTVPIAIAQAYGQLMLLRNSGVLENIGFGGDSLLPTLAAVASMTAGTIFLVWLGELISERGIGNGISLIIFSGIVSGFPGLIQQGFLSTNNGGGLLLFAIIALLIIALVVVFNEAHRRIPVQYGRSIFRSGRVYRQAGSSYLPIRVNSAGVIPLIFAFSVVILPGTVATFLADSSGFVGDVGAFFARAFSPGAFFYWVLTFVLVVAFTFFFTIVTFQQQALAENLQKSGGFVTGIRPGRPTQDYLNRVILRLTVGGALFLGFIAVIPFLASSFTNLQALQLSSTSLLILVSVALDTLRQLEAQLQMRNYEGFLR